MTSTSQSAPASACGDRRPAQVPPGTVSWVEVDRAALTANVAAFVRRLSGGAKLAAVVKSNAYGHGVAHCAPAALAGGASWLAVGGLGEAIELRQLVGHAVPILTLNHIPLHDLAAAVEHDLRVTIYDPAAVERLAAQAARLGRPARLHVKLETGTHRQGLVPADAIALAQQIATHRDLVFEGLSTHFADVEDTTDHQFAETQRQIYDQTVQQLTALGLRPTVRHIACSAATVLFPETHDEIARAGIGIYGLWPSRETLVSARERGIAAFELTPVLTWKCIIAQVKEVPVGSYVGYGRTWRATRATRVAVLPVGYYEGYDRGLSGRAHVLVAGKRAPVIGRICMNMTMVDITDIAEARAGEVAVLLGRAGEEQVRAEDLAAWAGTIHYEIVARIHPLLPRIAIS